jgi:hypothetical protein
MHLLALQGLLDLFELLPELMFSFLGGPAAALQGPPICKGWQQLALQQCSSIEAKVASAQAANNTVGLLSRKQDLKQLVFAGIDMSDWPSLQSSTRTSD